MSKFSSEGQPYELTRGKRDHHVVPLLGRGHALSRDCWCVPTLYVVCDGCDHDPGCWKCEGDGVVLLEYDDGCHPVVVVSHHRG